MKKEAKFLMFVFLCCLTLFLTTGEAYADNVLEAVRAKALSFLKGLRPVIFLLAGFGLIGFAYMAIFDKLSWKWFANIAMGLFLVANMGLFIDYFSGNNEERRELGYGNYIGGKGYAATAGVGSGPQSQSAKNDGSLTGGEGGTNPNSNSDQLGEDGMLMAGDFGEHAPAEGEGEEGSGSGEGDAKEAAPDPAKECAASGKAWTGSACVSKEDLENKIANEKRKCAEKKKEGYAWAEPSSQYPTGNCYKTDKQSNKDCKAEKGKDYEWDSSKQECVKTEKALKKECTSKGSEYVYTSSGECITKKEQCERAKPTTAEGSPKYVNGKCTNERDIAKQACKAQGSDYEFNDDGRGKWSCDKKKKAQKKECNNAEGYFWSDDYGRCIKEE